MGKLVKISATLVAMVFLIALVGCDEPTDTPKAAHNHVWSDWKHDTTKHWKECSCGTKTEEGNHAFENNKCKTCGYDKTIAVTSVTLSEKTLTLAAGGTKKLSAVVEPDDASSKTVTWESSNEAVATVGTDGTVTAVAEGDAKITAKAGDQKAECAVTVTKATPAESTHTHSYVGATWETSESEHWKECTADGCGTGALKGIAEKGVHEYNEASETPNNCTVCNYVRTVAVESVTLTPTALSFKVGETKKVTATIAPANASNKTVTWKSSNEGIAKVDQSGNVEAMGEGSATITAEADGKKGECSVTIIKAPQPDPEHQHNYNTENWSNDDTNHWNQCTAEGCTELGGKVNLAPHDWDNDNNKCTVCQKEKPVVPITGVVIDNEGSTIRIEIDGPITLTAHVNPAEADQAITWSSDKKDVANVSENGVVTGYKGGTATITAKAAGDETKTADRIIKVSCATHNYGSYTDNENGTHSAICEVCDKESKAEAHQFGDNDVCGCGAHKPLLKFSVIKGKMGDIESMTNNQSNLNVYKNNLDKYSFDTVEEVDDGWQITCDVEVSALQPATDGGAAGIKNIVAILEFDELKTFAIGNITSKQSGKALTDASWVTDAPKFVKNADEEKYTYVTLWISVVPGDDGNIPDRTYEIRAYEGDPNPKTLTFKFIDKPSEVSSFEELKTAVGNDYANIKLVENITLPETLVISNNATIDLNGCTIDRGESFEVQHKSDILAHGSHSSLIYIGEEEPTELATVTEKGAFKVLITDNSANRGKIDTGIYGIHAVHAQDDANVTLKNIEVETSFTGAEAALVRALDATITLNKAKVTAAGYGSSSAMVKTDEIGKVYIIGSEITGKGIGIMNWGTATIEKSQITVDTPLNKAIMALSYDGKISTVNVKESTIEGKIAYGAYAATDPTPIVNVDAESTLKKFSLFVQYDKKSENNLSITIAQSTDVTLAEDAIKEDKIADTYLAGALKNCTNVKDSEGKLITVDEAGNVKSSE